LEFLDGPYTVLGVIKPKDTEFLNSVRSHPQVTVLALSKDSREDTFKKGKAMLEEIIAARGI
jgi:hypothetical protein